jgi:hypothetical protein
VEYDQDLELGCVAALGLSNYVSDDEKISALRKYLDQALKQGVLLETVYTAFKLQEKKGYDIDKAFSESLWGWITFNAKNTDRERVSDKIED